MSKFQPKYNIELIEKFVIENSECKLLSKEYIGYSEKMKFECECGNPFITTFAKFKDRNKRQCNKCGRKRTSDYFRIPYSEIVEKIKNETNLILLTKESEYVDTNQSLKLICNCGEPFTTSYKYIFGNNQKQCQDCGKRKSDNAKRYSYQEVKEIVEKDGCRLISKEYTNTKSQLDLICKCGKPFHTRLEIIKTYNKHQCNDCGYGGKIPSLLEEKIEWLLLTNNVTYKTQYSFEDCRYKGILKFDFAIFDKNLTLKFLIEADGIQHFKPFEFYGGEENFKIIKKRDKIKDEYCNTNQIKLIRIPYYYKDEEIKLILFKELQDMQILC